MSGVEPQVEIEWMIGVVPALLGLYAITKLTDHTDGLLPFWQRRQPYNAITYRDGIGGRTATGILKTVAAQSNAADAFALRSLSRL